MDLTSMPSRRLALTLPIAGSCLVLTVASVMPELMTMIALDLRHVRLYTIEDHRLTSTTVYATSGSIIITTCVKVARLLLLWRRLWARREALLLKVATRRRTGRWSVMLFTLTRSRLTRLLRRRMAMIVRRLLRCLSLHALLAHLRLSVSSIVGA